MYHESGHFVIAHFLGVPPPADIKITPNHVRIECVPAEKSCDLARNREHSGVVI